MTTKEKELNKKLVEWIGREKCKDTKCELQYLTQSLDACFKRLIPAWNTQGRLMGEWIEGVEFNFMSGTLIGCTIQIYNEDYGIWVSNKNPALAFCLAFEKLISND